MATYNEAIKHVKSGGTAWDSRTWDIDSLLYLKDAVLYSHCVAFGTDQEYTPDTEDKESVSWELLNSEGL